jgi:4-hydroxyphenylpyruvate dioxygenase
MKVSAKATSRPCSRASSATRCGAGYSDARARDAGARDGVARLKKNKILIDADLETKQRKLLQIFTQNAIGPIFFEIIQRKGNEGFGEGNFQALFESIERDQMRRGVL